jgi:hypothetical protein
VRLDAEYVLPLKWSEDSDLDELVRYLDSLSRWVDVTVVDGSDDEAFVRHASRMPVAVRHLRPDPRPGRNGKVAGVMCGVQRARHDRVVIADDDIRYRQDELEEVVGLLAHADLVCPQNYFLQLPWHARWDTARTLINRAIGADYPGTLAVRRSTLLAAGGYDGDVLFENLELIRTIHAIGGREICAASVFVGRMPPTVRHFRDQRVRQAYDDFAQPARLAAELSLLPLLVLLTRRPSALVAATLAACAVAETGRRRNGGRAVFGGSSALWAPVWVLERSLCVWLALGARLRGGIGYSGARIARAATPLPVLNRRQEEKRR